MNRITALLFLSVGMSLGTNALAASMLVRPTPLAATPAVQSAPILSGVVPTLGASINPAADLPSATALTQDAQAPIAAPLPSLPIEDALAQQPSVQNPERMPSAAGLQKALQPDSSETPEAMGARLDGLYLGGAARKGRQETPVQVSGARGHRPNLLSDPRGLTRELQKPRRSRAEPAEALLRSQRGGGPSFGVLLVGGLAAGVLLTPLASGWAFAAALVSGLVVFGSGINSGTKGKGVFPEAAIPYGLFLFLAGLSGLITKGIGLLF